MIKKLFELLFSSTGAETAVNGVVNVAAIAALAPVALWFVSHKDEVLTTITYGQAAVLGAIVAVIVKVAHYAHSPAG